MKKSRLVLIVTIFMLFVGASPSFAVKSGFFLDLGSGSGEEEWDSSVTEFDVDTSTFSFGFALDSDPGANKVFNYRLNAGFCAQDLEDDFGVSIESSGIFVENIFGFALIKNKSMRWWAGPLVRLGLYSGDIEGTNVDVDYAEFATGVVTGLNIKAGKVIVSPSVGFRFVGYAGEGDDGINTEDFEGSSTHVFANMALLF